MANEKGFRTWFIGKLRRMSYEWEPRNNVYKRARVSRGQYLCAHCEQLFGPKDISVDHVVDVIPVTGFDSWDGVISRMFCSEEFLQVLCESCHDKKTAETRIERVSKRRKKKEEKE